jgi:hypothetical protein
MPGMYEVRTAPFLVIASDDTGSATLSYTSGGSVINPQFPTGARLSNGTSGFFLGAGGGSRTHFSHPSLDVYYGLLRDVSAARRLSRSAFGGQCQPRRLSPRRFRSSLLELYKLVENRIAYPTYDSISFHTSLATCLAASSVWTFEIKSLPVLKTDIL